MELEVKSPISAEAEVKKYTIVGDDIYVKRYTNENIPTWYRQLVSDIIAGDNTITDIQGAIDYLNTLPAGYDQKITELQLADTTINTSLTSLVATTGSHTAAIANLDITKVDSDSAAAISRDTVAAYFADGTAGAWFDNQISTYASDILANATDITTLSATLDGQSVSIDTIDTVLITTTGWAASAAKFITAPNGSITGWQLSNSSTAPSTFKVSADVFEVVASSQTAIAQKPFTVNATTGEITLNGKVSFNSVTGSLTPTQQATIQTSLINDDVGFTTSESFQNWVTTVYEPFVAQTDALIETFFGGEQPTLSNEPYTLWVSPDTRGDHLGDIYYDTVSGIGYRFVEVAGVYSWNVISDSGVAAALEAAAMAQDTADGKRRVFLSGWDSVTSSWVTQLPIPPYDRGDIFTPMVDTVSGAVTFKAKEVYVCNIAKSQGMIFANSDFVAATNYSGLAADISSLDNELGSLRTLTDAKIETYYQSALPHPEINIDKTSLDVAEYDAYIKDVWYSATAGNKTYIYKRYDNELHLDDYGLVSDSISESLNNGAVIEVLFNEEDLEGLTGIGGTFDGDYYYRWVETPIPEEVFDKIDGKKTIYTTQPSVYAERDILIPSATFTVGLTTFNADEVYIATKSNTIFNENDWKKATKYTDDTRVQNILDGLEKIDLSDHINSLGWTSDASLDTFLTTTYVDDIGNIQNQLDNKTTSYFGITKPFEEINGTLSNDGDTWYKGDTNELFIFKYSAGASIWVKITDADAVAAYEAASQAQATADGKIQNFTVQPTTPYDVGDTWMEGATGDIYVCNTARTNVEVFNQDDWVLASKYTDDTLAAKAEQDAATAQQDASNALVLLADIANDGKFTAVEKQSAKTEWDAIVSEKVKIDAQADALGVSKTTYGAAYTGLSNYIIPLLADLTTTSDIVALTFRNTWKTYYDARTDILNAIAAKASTMASWASVTGRPTSLNDLDPTANTLITDMISDSVLSATEKSLIRKEWDSIRAERDVLYSQGTTYSVTTERNTYSTKASALGTYLNNGTTWTDWSGNMVPLWIGTQIGASTSVIADTFRLKFREYYDARTALINAINAVMVKGTDIYTAGTTTIDGGKITTGSITASQIAATSVTADKLAPTTGNTTIWSGGGLISANFNGNSVGNIGTPTQGFRLSSNAVGTSSDPTIYGAYIKGGTLEGTTLSARDIVIVTDGGKLTRSVISSSSSITIGNSYSYTILTFDLYGDAYIGTTTQRIAGTQSIVTFTGITDTSALAYNFTSGQHVATVSYKGWVYLCQVSYPAVSYTVTVNGVSGTVTGPYANNLTQLNGSPVTINGITFVMATISIDGNTLGGIFIKNVNSSINFNASAFSIRVDAYNGHSVVGNDITAIVYNI